MSKQNKFTQSVMERLEQDAKRQKEREQKQTKQPEKAEVKAEKPLLEVKKEVKTEKVEQKKVPVKKKATAKSKTEVPDLSDFINKTPQRVAKNKTFYLDESVINALSVAAKEQNTTDSRLCNDILKTVLGVE